MFVAIMFALIFTLISLTEFVTGFQWGYRIINAVAIFNWWVYYRSTKEPGEFEKYITLVCACYENTTEPEEQEEPEQQEELGFNLSVGV